MATCGVAAITPRATRSAVRRGRIRHRRAAGCGVPAAPHGWPVRLRRAGLDLRLLLLLELRLLLLALHLRIADEILPADDDESDSTMARMVFLCSPITVSARGRVRI